MTATTETGEQAKLQEQFIEALAKLDAGEKALFRRNAGRTLSEARNVTGLFYRILPYGVPTGQHEAYFLVATLYPLVKQGSSKGNFGDSIRRIQAEGNRAALDRRVNVLLESDFNQLRFRLRQMLRLIDSRHGNVNWTQLLADLVRWNRRGRRVQRNWAMSYYGQQRPSDADTEEAPADNIT